MQSLKWVSRVSRKLLVLSPFSSVLRWQTVTWVIWGIFGFLSAIFLAWYLGQETVTEFFRLLSIWQDNPPSWMTAPDFKQSFFLFLPTIILLTVTQVIIKSSPQSKTWARVTIISILIILMVRYALWRTLATLNFSTPADGIFSIGLWLMEMIVLMSSIIQLYLLFNIKNRRQEADGYSKAVTQGLYTPSVDLFIPTYNEPVFILKRTIIGCQAIDYPNKKVYILDDTKRLEVQNLARELGCYYITRPDNQYAKAGNLNHALTKTQGELIVIFDADFVPTKNFLNRTIGFFQDKKIALVQTPQTFYNADPITKNLGLEELITPEEEIFYRQIQPIKDAAGSVTCVGTSFIVRRDYLKEVGCFVTESLSEDYFTGIRLSAKGYQVIYLNEKLSSGLAAESLSAHIAQRLRWARGTLQAFFISSNPLTIPGLNLRQRLAHLEGLLIWFSALPRLFFLLIPLIISCFNIVPIRLAYPEFIYIFLPYYLLYCSTYRWLNLRSRSIVFSELTSLILCFPIAVTVIRVMLNPFNQKFKVTPKGISRDKYIYNWKLALPLIVILFATALSLWFNLTNPFTVSNNLGFIWSSYNLLVISIALIALLDIPKPDRYEWFTFKNAIKIINAEKSSWGRLEKLSEGGAVIRVKERFAKNESVMIEIPDEKLRLKGIITQIESIENFYQLKVMFESLTLTQHRKLVEQLFCRPGQWKDKQTPGEIYSIFLLLKSLFTFILSPLLRCRPKFGLHHSYVRQKTAK